MDTNVLTPEMKTEVTIFSIIVGLSILVVCVVPCVLFALLSKYFQSQSLRRRSSTLRTVLSAGIKLLDIKDTPPLDVARFGVFGPVELPVSQLNCIERMVSIKSKLPCVVMWKAYAPAIMAGDDFSDQRLVAIRKLSNASMSDIHANNNNTVSHSNCLRSELQVLSQIQPHHFLQNLLAVCLHNNNPVALIMEYTPYGPLHTYLLIKRRGILSHNTNKWAGLDYTSEASLAIKAFEETERPCISPLLDDFKTRVRAFTIPLCEPLSEVDVLLFALQIAVVMDFLCEEGFPHKRLSAENILIGPGFYLKVMGVDFEVPIIHRANSGRALRRTASGRNQTKWDAPEVINNESYSEQSEVWRFAMTLWEICSLGDTPFEDFPSRSLSDLLKKGEVPGKPQGTSDNLYSLMTPCWKLEPSNRPMFSELIENIKDMLKAHEFGIAPQTSQLNGATTAMALPIVSSSPLTEQEMAPLMGRLSPTSNSSSGSLCRRPSRRPSALLIDANLSKDMSVTSTLSSNSSSHPLLDSPSTGYLETDV